MIKLNDIIVVVMLMPISFALASPQTNLQILENVYSDMCQELLASVSLADTNCVIEKSTPVTTYDWLIEKQIFASLQKAGVKQVYSGVSIEDAAKIRFQPIKQKISYTTIGDKKVQRNVDVQLQLRLVDSGNALLNVDIFSKSVADTLASKDIKNIEHLKYPFTVGERKRSFLKKIYEPVLVTALTGWIIYLFYSYRSQ